MPVKKYGFSEGNRRQLSFGLANGFVMPNYTCFIHPTNQAPSLDDICPNCGKPFGFPLSEEMIPRNINNREVVKAISRGFYGAVYLTRDRKTERLYAVKVIPKATYARRADGGYEKDFDAEARLHLDLSTSRVVARAEDWGEAEILFGSHTIPCHWLEMEFVEGRTLNEVIRTGPKSVREVAQVSWDLVDIIEQLHQREHYHNDLHGENILVIDLDERDARYAAIHPRKSIKVLDLGSADKRSKSVDGRLSDIHWVATHILDLVNSYERNIREHPPEDLRVCAQIRKVADHYRGIDRIRAPLPQDMKSAIHEAYSFGQRPWAERPRLASISEHYNAKTLPSWFAPDLFYDPSGRWEKKLVGSGPQLLYGMRGCGKTILLRSLEWSARIHPRNNEGRIETKDDVINRIKENEGFVGLFVSCSSLLQGSKPELVDAPVHRTFLAFAREIIRNVEVCELHDIGIIDYSQISNFVSVITRAIPWYEAPVERLDIWDVDRSLSAALDCPTKGAADNISFKPTLMFEELTRVSRKFVDLWRNKTFLFLLDDVSTRVLTRQNVDELIDQLCLQSPEFGFKVSTETQTLQLKTTGGELARPGRDYEEFDLGAEVFTAVGGRYGVKFIANILNRRAALTTTGPVQPASQVLGERSLNDLAEEIKEKRSGARYWGLNMLSGLCVGDVGDILQLYETILDRSDYRFPVEPAIQHRAALDLAQSKLRALLYRDEWLFAHATTFSKASNRELISSRERPRQFSHVYIHIDSGSTDVIRRVFDLVEAGVYVFDGGVIRSKTKGERHSVQYKLAYRKMLGLPDFMPLARRDRFEINNQEELIDWLENPSPDKLKWGLVSEEGPGAQNGDAGVAEEQGAVSRPQQLNLREKPTFPDARSLYDISILYEGDIEGVVVEWDRMHLFAAAGFEDRCLEGIRRIFSIGEPKHVALFKYADRGHFTEIDELLTDHSIAYSPVEVNDGQASVEEAFELVADQDIIGVDVTGLNKELIFRIVRKALVEREELWVFNTRAKVHYPTSAELEAVVAELEEGDILKFKELDEIVEGEIGPFYVVPIWGPRRDPNQPSVLTVFVPLKHSRVSALLEEVAVEQVVAIIPTESSGEESARSKAAGYLADHFVQQYKGEKYKVAPSSCQATYERLVKLHQMYSLDGGYNFELALTGSKMNTVAVGMLGAITTLGGVYYSRPNGFNKDKFTEGYGNTVAIRLKRLEK